MPTDAIETYSNDEQTFHRALLALLSELDSNIADPSQPYTFTVEALVHRGVASLKFTVGYSGETNIQTDHLPFAMAEFYRRHTVAKARRRPALTTNYPLTNIKALPR